jgi:hypothetical protein
MNNNNNNNMTNIIGLSMSDNQIIYVYYGEGNNVHNITFWGKKDYYSNKISNLDNYLISDSKNGYRVIIDPKEVAKLIKKN